MFFNNYYQKTIGFLTTAKNFDDVKNAPLPIDGSQVCFIIEDEPVIYMCGIVNGQKMCNGYTITPLENNDNNNDNNDNSRLDRVEQAIANLALLVQNTYQNNLYGKEGEQVNEPITDETAHTDISAETTATANKSSSKRSKR